MLFPLVRALEGEYGVLDSLYEQTFSNYTCLVLDLSADGQPTSVLSGIPHPSSGFKRYPGVSVTPALFYAMQHVTTPYTIVLGPRAYAKTTDIQSLVHHAKQKGEGDDSSWFYQDHTGPIVSRKGSSAIHNKPDIFLELFRSDSLLQLLGQIVGAGGGTQ